MHEQSTPLVLTRDLVRAVDRRAIDEYGLTGLLLMENAGRGVADRLPSVAPGPYLVCCGKGNNAGDGFVIARHLDNQRHEVHVALWADPTDLRGDALTNFRAIEHSGLPIEIFGRDANLPRLRDLCHKSGCLVDALLGTGAVGPPRSPLDAVIGELNASSKPIVAIDLPSGLDCDTGLPADPTIRALHTFTFVALKPGFLTPGAKTFTGDVEVLTIGAPRKLIEELLAQARRNALTPSVR